MIVPTTTVPLIADAGRRMHTNHLILARSEMTTRGTPTGPSGLSPAQLAGAYAVALWPNSGAGAIAIVDAYDYPTALADFNTFSSTFGLPIESSTSPTTSTNPNFQVVYASGSVPPVNGSWSEESAGDIEWSHAMAPNAKIYLVEAASDNSSDIFNAVNVAKSLPGVREVSTSFGSIEVGCDYVQYDSNFVQPGVAFFSSAGDTPGERDFPALSQNVVAVGGTTLNVNANDGWRSETVWNQTGCGPSAYEPRPAFQDAFYSKIGLYRASCDIVADGDPTTGVSVYDSTPYQGYSGWFVAGGTSIATPMIAGIANTSGVIFSSSQDFASRMYSHAGGGFFHPVAGSSGGFVASGPWSFPSGLGSPDDVGALLASG